MNPLDFLPSPLKAYGTLIAVGLLVLAVTTAAALFIHHERVIGATTAELKCTREKEAQHTADLKQAGLNAAETERRIAAQQEHIHDLEIRLAQATSDANDAARAHDRLRQRAATLVERAASSDSTPAERQQAASTLNDSLQSCTDAYRQLANDSDVSYARGLKCEADYDALTAGPGAGGLHLPTRAEPNPSPATP